LTPWNSKTGLSTFYTSANNIRGAVCDNYLNVQQDILENFVDRGQLHHLTQPTEHRQYLFGDNFWPFTLHKMTGPFDDNAVGAAPIKSLHVLRGILSKALYAQIGRTRIVMIESIS